MFHLSLSNLLKIDFDFLFCPYWGPHKGRAQIPDQNNPEMSPCHRRENENGHYDVQMRAAGIEGRGLYGPCFFEDFSPNSRFCRLKSNKKRVEYNAHIHTRHFVSFVSKEEYKEKACFFIEKRKNIFFFSLQDRPSPSLKTQRRCTRTQMLGTEKWGRLRVPGCVSARTFNPFRIVNVKKNAELFIYFFLLTGKKKQNNNKLVFLKK